METAKFSCLICCESKAVSEISNCNREKCHKFCVIMCRYLDFDSLNKATKTKTMNISNNLEIETRDIFCCNNCQVLVESVCDLHDSLESLRLRLNRKIQTVSEIMEEKSENLENGSFHYDGGGQDTGSIFREKFLKRVLDKRSSHNFPHLPLERCSLTQPFVNATSVKIEEMEEFAGAESVQNLISTENDGFVIKTEVDDDHDEEDDYYQQQEEQNNFDHNQEEENFENNHHNHAQFDYYDDNGDQELELITVATEKAANFGRNDDQDPLENDEEKSKGKRKSGQDTDRTIYYPPWECKICGKLLRSSKTQHMATHSEKNFRCGDCGLSFKHYSSLYRHKTGKHSKEAKPNQAKLVKEKKENKKKIFPRPKVARNYAQDPWICKICGKVSRSSMKQHLASHSTERRFQCDQCDLRFKHGPSLTRHKLDSHSPPDAAKAQEEKKNRKESSVPVVTTVLRGHRGQSKNGRRKGVPWSCKICGKVIRGSKKQHFDSHSTEKGFQCEDCGKSFKYKANLAHHKRLKHSPAAVRPWEEKNFAPLSRVTPLKTEPVKNDGSKTTQYLVWKCNICGKVLRSSRKQHLETHAGGRNFQCNECDLRFRHKSSLARHKGDAHPRTGVKAREEKQRQQLNSPSTSRTVKK